MRRLPDQFSLFWDQRLVRLLGGVPLVAAMVVVVVLFLSFLFLAWGTGIYALLDAGSIPEIDSTFGLDPYTWAALVTSLLMGFGVSAGSFAAMNDEHDMRAAANLLAKDADQLVSDWFDYLVLRLGKGRLVAAFFYIAGLGVSLWNIPGAYDVVRFWGEGTYPWFQQVPAAWFLVFVPLNFALLGKGAYFTVAEERYQFLMRQKYLRPQLLHPEMLAPFTRMALRRSFLWIVGSSIALLLFLNESIEVGGLLPFLVAIVVVAVIALFGPLTGIHSKIAETKRGELAVVRQEIVRLKERVLRGKSGAVEASHRLSGLIAYEARLERVSEWPIDMPTMGRFSLYLAIPVFSWVGGALMERLVDLLI